MMPRAAWLIVEWGLIDGRNRVRRPVTKGRTAATPRIAGRGWKRRRGAGIRRSDDRKSAEEGEMTVEQFEFVMAIETYKKVNKKMFPTWTEVLEVIEQLGYRKIEKRQINLEAVPEPDLHSNIKKAA